MKTRSLSVSLVALCVSCSGTIIDGAKKADDGVATGGSPADNESVASGGKASGGAGHATGGRLAEGGAGPEVPAMGGMGGEAPIKEKPTPIPSAACSVPAPVPEDMKLQLDLELGYMPIALPPGYDGAVPGPLIFAFPASNDGLPELLSEDPSTPNPLLADYVIARPRADSLETNGTWEGQSVELYDAAYRELASQVCFDEARVLGVGNGGGGRFLVALMKQPSSEEVVRPRDFLAMAVSGPVGNRVAPWPGVPLLFIHSTVDERGRDLWNDPDGQKALEKRRISQDCSEMSMAAGTNTYFITHHGEVTYECSDFVGCSSPLRFCSHDKFTELDFWETPHNVELHRFFADYL